MSDLKEVQLIGGKRNGISYLARHGQDVVEIPEIAHCGLKPVCAKDIYRRVPCTNNFAFEARYINGERQPNE